MEGVNVGMVEDNTSPPRPISLGKWAMKIEIADLKSQHAIKADGARHIGAGQRDGGDVLDPRGNAPIEESGLTGILPTLVNQAASAAVRRPRLEAGLMA
jgi:hypothetical protein